MPSFKKVNFEVLQTSFYGHWLVNPLDCSMTVRREYFRVARFA